MLDIKLFRTDSKEIEEKLKQKHYNDKDSIENIIKFDIELRNFKTIESDLNAKRNSISNEISSGFKNNLDKDKIESLKEEVKNIKNEIEKITILKNDIEKKIENIINYIPNTCLESVPVGKDEKDNALISKHLEPTKFNFEPLAH
jgi:seryl-tRNA synthetase